jgi:hypothetical protein
MVEFENTETALAIVFAGGSAVSGSHQGAKEIQVKRQIPLINQIPLPDKILKRLQVNILHIRIPPILCYVTGNISWY